MLKKYIAGFIIGAVATALLAQGQSSVVKMGSLEITGLTAGFVQLFTSKGSAGPSITLGASEAQVDSYKLLPPTTKPNGGTMTCPEPDATGVSQCVWERVPKTAVIPTMKIQGQPTTITPANMTIPEMSIQLK